MRLLQFAPSEESERLEIKLCEYQVDVPPYAIFSHRWGSVEDEVSFHDLTWRRSDAQLKKGYEKIEPCCRQALKDELTHAWIDTCCIDKTSSAELSEAINSMYKWYTDSHVCYAYLSDVKSKEDMKNSNWFTRAWTLQELIAPRKVVFFSADWTEIGEKRHMAKLIYAITNIAEEVLIHRDIEDVCISQKMCWASKRQSTRIEDRAYSLLGLFNISLPILYGEGLRAFTRLQEKIIRTSVDHTIFAWDLTASDHSGLFADSPNAFANLSKIRKMAAEDYMEKFNLPSPRIDYALTNNGLEILLPYLVSYNHVSLHAAFLACYYEDSGKSVVLYLRRSLHHRLSDFFFRTKLSSHSLGDEYILQNFDKGKTALGKVLIRMPEKPWARAIRPLLPEEIAKPSNLSNELDIKGYNVRLMSSGTVLATYPMPHNLDKTEFTVDTSPDTVWVASLLFHETNEVKVVFAVINNELISHLVLTNDLKNQSTLEAFLSCEAYYKKDKLFPSELCKSAKLSVEDSKTDTGEDMIIKVLNPKLSYTDTPKRKVFTFQVDLKSREEWEGPKQIDPGPIVQSNDEELTEYGAYVKAIVDAAYDISAQDGFDFLWQSWKQVDDTIERLPGPKGSKQNEAYLYCLWEGRLKDAPQLGYDESNLTKYGKLWRQLIGIRFKSGKARAVKTEQRKLVNSMILTEHMRITASDAPDSEAVKRVYEEMWGVWKSKNATLILVSSHSTERKQRKATTAYMEEQRNNYTKNIEKLYSQDFDKKEVSRFQDFWRLLIETGDVPEDTFGEGFTPEFRQKSKNLAPTLNRTKNKFEGMIGSFGPSLP